MSRAAATLCLTIGVAVAALGAVDGGSVAGAVPPTTTIASVGAGATPTTIAVTSTGGPPTSTVPRGGASSGGVAKPEDEPWSVQRLVTTTALLVVALAASGYAYGRVRSTSPRHPDLVRSPE